MKKVFVLFVSAVMVAACSAPTKLVNTATHRVISVAQPVAAVFADLEVSPAKISYFMMPSKTVINAGYENVINTAVREALIANGNADVLVGMESQVKYDKNGMVESVTVTGYPAKYVNFRSPGDEYLREMKVQEKGNSVLPFLDKIKKGK